MIDQHIIKRTITEIVIDPSHAEREESAEFRRSKARLKEDGHYHCWTCGTTEDIQIHHRAAEWMFEQDVDFDKMKQYCEENDTYGYGRLLRNKPITSVDDVRNCQALCRKHHIEKGTGIHELTYPAWLMQKLAKDGCNPVPQSEMTAEEILQREG